MLTFNQFIRERMDMWWGKATQDPILRDYAFTNMYRILDRQSQFVMNTVMCDDWDDFMLRSLVHRTFLRDDTWDTINQVCDGYLCMRNWNPERVKAALAAEKSVFHRVYKFGHKAGKYQHPNTFVNRIDMIDDMMNSTLPGLLPEVDSLEGMVQAFKTWPLHQNFTALQFSLDLNYWLEYPEDYAPLGPGSKRGLALAYPWVRGTADPVRKAYEETDWTGFHGLHGHDPTLVDSEHMLCEYAKYVALHSKPNNKKYKPDGRKIEYKFPSTWEVHL